MVAKLAWRNVWRNKRRTLITAASIMFAVFFSAFMLAIQQGAWDNLLGNMVNYYVGYAQIHSNGYWEEQTIDKAFPVDEKLDELRAIPEIQDLVPRIESYALAAYEEGTTGVLVVGVDPEVENNMTQLESRLIKGYYFKEGEQAILIGAGIAENLKLTVGDTLVLISQGYRGVNAAGKYPVKGILKFGSPDLNKRMVYLPLATAQWFFGADNLVTSLALDIGSKEETVSAIFAVEQQIGTEAYEIMDWKAMLPDLVEARALDAASNQLVLLILYVIITFGIFGTILMMTKEREYEFGVLISIGMSRWKLAVGVWLELFFVGIVGTLAGIALSVPLVYFFHLNPIDLSIMGEEAVATYEKFGMEPLLPTALNPDIFTSQALIVFLITTVLAVYPFWKIFRLQPVAAMRA